jgi:hypothetical protein
MRCLKPRLNWNSIPAPREVLVKTSFYDSMVPENRTLGGPHFLSSSRQVSHSALFASRDFIDRLHEF